MALSLTGNHFKKALVLCHIELQKKTAPKTKKAARENYSISCGNTNIKCYLPSTYKYPRRGSNPQPSAPEADALSNCATGTCDESMLDYKYTQHICREYLLLLVSALVMSPE